MAKQLVYVEINPNTSYPIRIIKSTREALLVPAERLRQMSKKSAVGYIREQIVARAKRGHSIQCEYCSLPINEFIGEMHEKIPKGKGGEVSLDNCVFICNECHTGRTGEHGDRYFQTSKNKEKNG